MTPADAETCAAYYRERAERLRREADAAECMAGAYLRRFLVDDGDDGGADPRRHAGPAGISAGRRP